MAALCVKQASETIGVPDGLYVDELSFTDEQLNGSSSSRFMPHAWERIRISWKVVSKQVENIKWSLVRGDLEEWVQQ